MNNVLIFGICAMTVNRERNAVTFILFPRSNRKKETKTKKQERCSIDVQIFLLVIRSSLFHENVDMTSSRCIIASIFILAPYFASSFVIMPSTEPAGEPVGKSNGDLISWSIQKQKEVSQSKSMMDPSADTLDYSDFETEIVDILDPNFTSLTVNSFEVHNDREPEETDSSEIKEVKEQKHRKKEKPPLHPHWWDLVDHPTHEIQHAEQAIHLPDPAVIQVSDDGLFDY